MATLQHQYMPGEPPVVIEGQNLCILPPVVLVGAQGKLGNIYSLLNLMSLQYGDEKKSYTLGVTCNLNYIFLQCTQTPRQPLL